MLIVSYGFVSLLLVSPASVIKESSSYRFSDSVVTSLIKHGTSSRDRKVKTLHNLYQLFLRIHRPFQRSALHKSLETPSRRTIMLLPGIENIQEGKMISLLVIESRFLLIGYLLLILWPIKYVLYLYHRSYRKNLIHAAQIDGCQ